MVIHNDYFFRHLQNTETELLKINVPKGLKLIFNWVIHMTIFLRKAATRQVSFTSTIAVDILLILSGLAFEKDERSLVLSQGNFL